MSVTRALRRAINWTWTIFKLVWRISGIVLAIIGWAGVSEDLSIWESWIDTVVGWINIAMSDPRVQILAQRGVEIAEFINQWWVRGLLVVVGLSIVVWAWRPFWLLRHRLIFWGRRIVSNAVWVSEVDAHKVVRNSEWAKIKEPQNSFLETLSGLNKPAVAKFSHFITMTLNSFAKSNPASFKTTDEGRQFDEVALRRFLNAALEAEVEKTYGEPPNFRVS